MDSSKIRYWFDVHSKCRLEYGKSEDDLEWYFKDIDIVRFCDEIAALHEEGLADANARIEALHDLLGSIDGMYKFILDDSAVSDKPKPTWQEFADWVHEQVSKTLNEGEE